MKQINILLFTPLIVQNQIKNYLVDKLNNCSIDTFSVFCGVIIFILSIIIVLIVLVIKAELQIIKTKKELEKKEQKLNEIQQKAEKLVKKANCSFVEIIRLAKTNDPLFLAHFQEIYSEFTYNLFKKYPDLISGEFLLCAMIYFNFSSKEIAEYMQVKHRSIQIRKSRLRKKMNLSPDVDLHHHMKTLAVNDAM